MSSFDYLQRSPISVLQEESVKQSAMPEYTLVESTSSYRPFRYRVQVLGIEAYGSGTNKKEAKAAAAKAMLEIFPFAHQPQTPSSTLIGKNYIGMLQEYCVKNNHALPQFSLVGMSGPPHSPIFTCQVIVLNTNFKAKAYTKKDAKNKVAQKAWESIVETRENPSVAVRTNPINAHRVTSDPPVDMNTNQIKAHKVTPDPFDLKSLMDDLNSGTTDDPQKAPQKIADSANAESADLKGETAFEKMLHRVGDRRSFGKYYCERCDNKWASAYAWEGFYQKCHLCLGKVYPNELSDVKEREEEDEEPSKPHVQELCQKCCQLGSPCFKI